MATPLGTLLQGLRDDVAVRAHFDVSPLAFLHDHGWGELEPADLREALYLMADARPPADAALWITGGDAIDTASGADLEATAAGLHAALGAIDAADERVDLDPADLDGFSDVGADDRIDDTETDGTETDDTGTDDTGTDDGTDDTGTDDGTDDTGTDDGTDDDGADDATVGHDLADEHAARGEAELDEAFDGSIEDSFDGIDEAFTLDTPQRGVDLPDSSPGADLDEHDDGWGDIIA